MRLQFTSDLPREDILIGIVVADGVRAVYCPLSSFTRTQVEAVSAELRDWLVASDPDARGVSAVLEVGALLELKLPSR